MKNDLYKAWMDTYGRGWINKDTQAILDIFTEDATYMYTPFHDLIRGKAAIKDYIDSGAGEYQKDIKFSYELLGQTDDFAVVRWKASLGWIPTDETIRFDGIYHVYLNDDGLCFRFDEWWHSIPPLPEENAPNS